MVAACLGHAWMDIASNATRREILSAWRRLGRLSHAQLCTARRSEGAGGIMRAVHSHTPHSHLTVITLGEMGMNMGCACGGV